MNNANGKRSLVRNEEGLRWLIALASSDLNKVSKGLPRDLPNLLYDLKKWFGASGDPNLSKQIRGLLKRRELLTRMVKELSALVGAVADRGKFTYRYTDGHVEIDAGRLEGGSGRLVRYRFTDLPDAMIHLAVHDLTRNDPLLVRRCREQSCRKIFLASRRSQMYCSHRCANLQAGRKYRVANRARRAERERERYRSKVQARIGSGAIKIGRRAQR